MSILSFRQAFHGRLFGSLSTTRSKPIHKLDIPSFDWPQADFPALRYPLEKFAKENEAEEARCLKQVEDVIKQSQGKVAGLVVEPIQSEGGDNHASPKFFQGLRDITKRYNVVFIVDEVQTGVGSTGTFWAHEKWNLSNPPDIVTFSKKFQAAGWYFNNRDLIPNMPYRQFNTWMGDPVRALLAKSIISQIRKYNLIENTKSVGNYLYEKLEGLAGRYPSMYLNLRGKNEGTFIAWTLT